MKIKQVLVAAVVLAAIPHMASAVTIAELDFENNAEDWTVRGSSGPLTVTYELGGDSTNLGFSLATGAAGTANGSIRHEQQIFAPAGFTMQNIKVTGLASGFSSWVMDGRVGISPGSNAAGTPLTTNYSFSAAASDPGVVVVDTPFELDASGDILFTGISSFYVTIENIKGLDSVWQSNNIRELVVTADLIPEPASMVLLGLGGMMMMGRRRSKA